MDRFKTSGRWLLGMALALTFIGFLDAHGTFAHAVPERANPPMNSAVPVMPSTIEVWFSEEVVAEGTTLQVLRLDGAQVDQGNSAVDLQDPTRTRVTVDVHSGLDNGEYLVQWTAASAVDGDSTSGSYRFTVDPAASPVPLPQIAAQQAPAELPEIDAEGNPVDTGRDPLLYGGVAAVAGLALVGLIVFWYFRRAAHGRRWSDRPVDRI